MTCPMTYCHQASITYDDINDECEQNYWKSQSRRGEMYGMLLESIQHYVQELYGEDVWQKVLEHAGLKNMIFTTHKVYKDEIMVNLARSCSEVLGDRNFDECMYFFGQCFVDFCRHYGYDKVLRVAGRHYRDFLNGIDNLHETIRFSYPKLQSPSFIVDMEDSNGCVLTYRSKRVGFAYYVTGQLTQCAKRLYNVDVSIRILQEIHTNNGCHVKYRLDFQNYGFNPPVSTPTTTGCMDYPRIASTTFFKLFPFCILFDRDMVIRYAGPNLTSIFRGQALIGCKLYQKFGLRRPLVDFTWENIMYLQKVIFEVESYQPLVRQCKKSDCRCADNPSYHTAEDSSSDRLLLRGQMKYVDDWACLAFLCTPLIGNLEDMLQNGLYINDLNMFDNSQDMVLAGWHHASQLEYLVDQVGVFISLFQTLFDNSQDMVLAGWHHASQLEYLVDQVGVFISLFQTLFDNSQDMVLAGWHHASQLEYLVDQVGVFISLFQTRFDNSQDMVLAGWHHASQLEYLVDQVGVFISLFQTLFDNSQDMVLAGWHHASQLEYLVDQVGVFSSLFQTLFDNSQDMVLAGWHHVSYLDDQVGNQAI